jgi:hypothetical protein
VGCGIKGKEDIFVSSQAKIVRYSHFPFVIFHLSFVIYSPLNDAINDK